MERRALPIAAFLFLTLLSGCGSKPPPPIVNGPSPDEVSTCRAARPMRVRFYDVGQALAALVTLPDGHHVLVDTGESAHRPGCGLACAEGNQRLLAGLSRDVGDAPIAVVWITHPHSDHLGGAIDVLSRFKTDVYVDNGRDVIKPIVEKARDEAEAMGARLRVVDPHHRELPVALPAGVSLTPVLPDAWPDDCNDDANDCSIALRIDYCQSSILFTGDAESKEEAALPVTPVTLLQVAHHGSDTSSTEAFLDRAKPRYAVISAGRPNAGTNAAYCHPRASTIERLDRALGGATTNAIRAFDGRVKCEDADAKAHWVDVPASNRLWSTSRDGDVTLVTHGDGTFVRE